MGMTFVNYVSMAFDSKDNNIKNKNKNLIQRVLQLKLDCKSQNVVVFLLQGKKYTHKPFESKCFLSFFI